MTKGSTAQQIAREYGVCVKTVYRWAREGRLIKEKVTHKTVFYSFKIKKMRNNKER